MSEKTISKDVYYQALGLMVVHKDLEKRRADVEKSLAGLLEIEGDGMDGSYFGHITDALFNESTLDEMLNRINTKVE